MRVVIVVPTYNEEENVGRFIDVLVEEFKNLPNHEFHILVVDGNSKDNTQKLVEDAGAKYPFVHLLVEQAKNGLGAAYMFGFRYAMDQLHADVLVEMDADFQHDPKDLVRLIHEIDNGADYVIGSRFAKGGTIPSGWAFYRKFISFGGSLFSKIVLGIYSINDFTSGFKASRVKGFADSIEYSTIMSKGFAYKLDLLYRMYLRGAKIVEVPIKFGLRDRGDSKMEKNNFMDSLKVVLLLRYNKSKSFFKFVIVGFVGLFVDTFLFNAFRVLMNSSYWAAPLSGLFGMTTTFLLNNFWSFGERKMTSLKQSAYSIVIYVASSFFPIFVRTQMVVWATGNFGDTFLVSNAAFFIGILFGLIWNYTVYSRIIWRKASSIKK